MSNLDTIVIISARNYLVKIFLEILDTIFLIRLKMYLKNDIMSKKGVDFVENMGERIKRLREQKGMTQDDLAQRLGVNKAAVSKYEKGIVENLKRTMIKNMANILNVSPSYLMCLEDEQTQEEKGLATEVRFLEELQIRYGKQAVKMLEMLASMNEAGQKKALEQIELLTNIPQYMKGE